MPIILKVFFQHTLNTCYFNSLTDRILFRNITVTVSLALKKDTVGTKKINETKNN